MGGLASVPGLGTALQGGFSALPGGGGLEGLPVLDHRPAVLIADLSQGVTHLRDQPQLHLGVRKPGRKGLGKAGEPLDTGNKASPASRGFSAP